MIRIENIQDYHGKTLKRSNDYLYIPPDNLLCPYISCYTITRPASMSDEYTIMPSASSTIVIAVDNKQISSRLRGVNTKASNVGVHANKMILLLLIEFYPGGLYPFLNMDQLELIDQSILLNELDRVLTQNIEMELIKAEDIDSLVKGLDKVFLTRLMDTYTDNRITEIRKHILIRNGNVSTQELSSEFYYSERHIRRLFMQYIGTTPKMFARIVRMNYAMRLMQNNPSDLTDVTVIAGFFDQLHFIHDFKSICGISPMDYIKDMSVYYNDEYKMWSMI